LLAGLPEARASEAIFSNAASETAMISVPAFSGLVQIAASAGDGVADEKEFAGRFNSYGHGSL
jgi:hypothetical protein